MTHARHLIINAAALADPNALTFLIGKLSETPVLVVEVRDDPGRELST